ncbi:unnamed protein product [Adineta steineri]|uniref:NAD(P)(+)--arginine ADP-ribosyltransferase n=1 Tax=Adineta steineri TaxID=433720 RepID=A0A818IJD8_9BILA|nr:unnamed protein product [Adineta steineri]CAF3525459.1 unnamed protein product [Adineta steineri]CAF3677057.1 unnamed protein product [Adineta steineri]
MAAKKSQKNFGSAFSIGASNTIVPSTHQRMAQNYLLVWVDGNIDQTNKDCQNTLTQLRAAVNDVMMFNQSDECIQFLNQMNDEQAFVITSGALGKNLVPEIHDMPKLDAIYIFCGNVSYHQQWTENWKKIKGVHNNIKDSCDALKEGVKKVNQDLIPIIFVAMNEAASTENLNRLEPNYMYTQMFKDIFLEMEHDYNQATKILAIYCYKFYPDNTDELNVINEFKRDYRPEQAIWWYTRECFTYQMLNRALRTLDADTIINMGFFIRDLHQQLHQLHEQQLPSYHGKPFIVYRGQGLLKTDFEKLKKTKGGLMSFDNFLSTSTKKDVSLQFAKGALKNTDMVGILFIMTIDPRVSSTPFASIKEVSYHKIEEEILFPMHTVFRIGAIKQMNNNDQLYQVELQLTADDDEQLQRLTEFISKGAEGKTGWNRLGMLLVKTGYFDKAEELHNALLEQPSSESEKATYYNNLGYVKDAQGDYGKAIKYYVKALGIEESTLPENHPLLATSYNNIGETYRQMGDYSKSVLFHEKALEIREKTLPANHLDLATSCNNIGTMYHSMGEYLKALSFYEKALRIREKTLSENHPDLAISYNNIGGVYVERAEYSKALSFFDKTREIIEKTLPANHPDLATSYNNIGGVYRQMGEYSKAVSFHEKALGIEEKTLPENHPDLAISYNNIGELYNQMGNYSKALSFYEKALGIREQILPDNHSDLATSYNNIGTVYHNMGAYSKALSFYEKALGIKELTLSENHSSLAIFYNNIGSVYNKIGEYSKALSFYEKALGIKELTLPENHSSLATSYNNIGLVYKNMGEYLKALSFQEKALGIEELSLPENHPSLAIFNNNIGSVYNKIGEYSKALSFYEKALRIKEKTLPANHPSLGTSYNNIGSIYYNMKEYSKALSYFERALDIRKVSLPPNHPDLEDVKQSIAIIKEEL